MLRSQLPLSYWTGLLQAHGDLGGNCRADGTRTRTPYAGPPPEFWSDELSAVAYNNTMREAAGAEMGCHHAPVLALAQQHRRC